MARDLGYYFDIPIVQLFSHIIIWGAIAANIVVLLNYNIIARDAAQTELAYQDLANKNSIIDNQNKYYQSSLYEEKFAKTNDYKVPGEIVINTYRIENPALSPTIYYPDTNKNKNTKLKNWYNCLIKGQENNLNTFLC